MKRLMCYRYRQVPDDFIRYQQDKQMLSQVNTNDNMTIRVTKRSALDLDVTISRVLFPVTGNLDYYPKSPEANLRHTKHTMEPWTGAGKAQNHESMVARPLLS